MVCRVGGILCCVCRQISNMTCWRCKMVCRVGGLPTYTTQNTSNMTYHWCVVYVVTFRPSQEWDSLQERGKNSRISIMKKIVSGRVAINSDDYLTRNNTRTRSVNSDKFKHYSTKTEVFKNSYFPITIPQWNNTPDQTVHFWWSYPTDQQRRISD